MQARFSIALAALALTLPASPQTIQKIVETGDALSGMGNVTVIQGPTVNDQGQAIVYVVTDNSNPSLNTALLDKTGTPIFVEGHALSQPSGAAISSFSGGVVNPSTNGPWVYLLGMSGTSGTSDDEGYFYGPNPDLALQESSISLAPQFPAGSKYVSMLTPYINDSLQVAFHTMIDDPNIAGTFNTRAVMVVDLLNGTHQALIKQGDIPPGQSFAISSFTWDAHAMAFNNAGQVMWGGEIVSAPATNQILYLGLTEVAQKGDPSPFGSTYLNVSTSTLGCDLNNQGEYVFLCTLGNTGRAINRNGEAFVQSGEILPDIEPYALSEFGQGIFIGDDGRVFWTGLWNRPDGTQVTGLFVDYSLLIEEGVTEIGGQVVADLAGLDRHIALSRSGQYVVFLATLQNGVKGAYLIDLWQ
jgi:hypothetical protein